MISMNRYILYISDWMCVCVYITPPTCILVWLGVLLSSAVPLSSEYTFAN